MLHPPLATDRRDPSGVDCELGYRFSLSELLAECYARPALEGQGVNRGKMKTCLRIVGFALVLSLVVCSVVPAAMAAPPWRRPRDPGPPSPGGGGAKSAPEIDAAAAGSAVALLVGGGLLLRARRSRARAAA